MTERANRQSKTLMVTPYAPYRDGIAAYAIQEVAQRIDDGENVEVLSPLPSAAQHHIALGDTRGALSLLKRASQYSRIVVQFYPELFFGKCTNPVDRVGVWTALHQLTKRTSLELRVHEIEYGPLERNPLERAMAKRTMASAAQVLVHTKAEAQELATRLELPSTLFEVVDHGANFAPAVSLTQAEARSQLGLDSKKHVYVCIGFIQEHKGFDRAVRAFAAAHPDASELHIVGSVRVDVPELLHYANGLGHLVNSVPNAFYHQKYVSDATFDMWLIAADTVVLPYREIWSSGVLERAKLFGKEVFAADIGGLGDQADARTELFSTDDALVKLFQKRSGLKKAATAKKKPVPLLSRDEIELAMREAGKAQRVSSAATNTISADSLHELNSLKRPEPTSHRPAAAFVKKLVFKCNNWQIEPLVKHIESLQQATTQAVDSLEKRLDKD